MLNKNYEYYLEWKRWGDEFGYVSSHQSKYYDLELRDVIEILGKNNLRVLEIGYGNGSFLGYCFKKKWEVYGIEINEKLVDLAKGNGFNAYSSLGSVPDNYFDLIVAFDVIEHVSNDEIVPLLNNIKRKINKDGLCLFRFPNGDSPMGMKNQNGDLTHNNFIGSEKILQLCKISKLNLVKIRGEKKIIKVISFKETLYNIISYIIRSVLDVFIKFVYFRGTIYFFSPQNLIVIIDKNTNF
ncbi:class I SAM-dependent methyltransferase [Acinetobacter johnsonii]|uniref:class I SAM-dependent methyltransferase n=1 Tax=Acinetobacter johnsonii TaxID=40214 RepID=UPI003D175686